MRDRSYFNHVALVAAATVLVAGVAGIVLAPGGGPVSSGHATTFVNLTISIDPANGLPRFTPANFTVAPGRVVVTIVDLDAVARWAGCTCRVTGTVGGVEYVNGTAVSVVPAGNVAHTFTVPSLGLNIIVPGQSVVRFSFETGAPGSFPWMCVAPCGAGADPYTTAPMGVPGYMAGTIQVA